MAADWYPVSAFYFKVNCGFSDETSFQEVSGISYEMETESIAEGGENRFTYSAPKGRKFQNLKLKRGFLSKNSELLKWCTETLEGDLSKLIKPKNLTVILMDANGKPVCSWNFQNAYPVKWEIGSFNSMNNEIAAETIEFKYNYMNKNS